MDYIFIAVAIFIVIAIIITVSVLKKKKNGKETNNQTEKYEDFIVPENTEKETEPEQNEEEPDFTPVTFSEDVFVSFEGISDELADSIAEHSIMSSDTSAIKPDAPTRIRSDNTQTVKPAKPAVSTTEYLEKTTLITNEEAQSENNITDTIASFFNGKYYFDGEMISGGEKTPLELAINSSDFQLFSEMDGKDISIMAYEGKYYLLNPDTKKYIEITSSLQKMMGIDASKFTFEFNKTNIEGKNPSAVTKAHFNGQDAVCYTYRNETAHMDFIASDNEIKQIILYNSDGNVETVLAADEFSAEIPDEMLNFKGYSKTNMISFMSSLM